MTLPQSLTHLRQEGGEKECSQSEDEVCKCVYCVCVCRKNKKIVGCRLNGWTLFYFGVKLCK